MLKEKIFRNKGFKYTPEIFFKTVICSWFFTSFLNFLFYEKKYTDLAFVQEKILYIVLTAVIMLVLTLGLTAIEYYLEGKKITEYSLIFSFVAFALMALYEGNADFGTALALCIVGAMVAAYAVNKGCFDFGNADINKRTKIIYVAIITSVFAFVLASYGVLRYWTYNAPNYDFGIFCQMYYNLSKTLIPNTTCERDYLLSHFAVHFSPIYYILLPVYWIFPFAETLQISQAVILYSGIIPLLLLAKEKCLSNKLSAALTVIYCAYPALSMGCNFDFHENCFLLPLLLWMFYFCEREKYIPMAIFTVLALMVKEDVFIYIVIYGIFLIASRRKYKLGSIMCAGAIAYFIMAYTILTKNGLGIMDDSRFGNLIFGDGGLVGVVKTFFTNPAYTLSQMFVDGNNGLTKIIYIIEMLGALAFLPFITKKMSRYILIAPILINLLSAYRYQCEIGFQYHFGITAFLFYATVLNLADLKPNLKRYLTIVAVMVSVFLYIAVFFPNVGGRYESWRNDKEMYKNLDEVLETQIPDDASVACNTYLLSHLSNREEIYEIYYHFDKNGNIKTDVDYVVYFTRGTMSQNEKNSIPQFKKAGYKEIYRDDLIFIYVSPDMQ